MSMPSVTPIRLHDSILLKQRIHATRFLYLYFCLLYLSALRKHGRDIPFSYVELICSIYFDRKLPFGNNVYGAMYVIYRQSTHHARILLFSGAIYVDFDYLGGLSLGKTTREEGKAFCLCDPLHGCVALFLHVF